jgi:hypothetical protein
LPCPAVSLAVPLLPIRVAVPVAWQRRLPPCPTLPTLTGHDRGTGAGSNPREAIQPLKRHKRLLYGL